MQEETGVAPFASNPHGASQSLREDVTQRRRPQTGPEDLDHYAKVRDCTQQ